MEVRQAFAQLFWSQHSFTDFALLHRASTARNTNTFDSALQADGSVRVLAGSTKSKTFEGTDGEVCTITVKAAEGIADGTYTIVLKNIIMSDATGKTYKVDRSEATVTIDSATGITAIGTKALNGKYMRDGKLTILRNGKKYTAVGMEEQNPKRFLTLTKGCLQHADALLRTQYYSRLINARDAP